MHARAGGRLTPDYPPVILLHGLSISSRYMASLAAEVARWTLVHAIDLPGFGLSGNPETILDIPGLPTRPLTGWSRTIFRLQSCSATLLGRRLR